MLLNIKNKLTLLLAKVLPQKQAMQENKILETPLAETPIPDENKAVIVFYVKKTSPDVYEVSLKNFLGINGRGTNPEQALTDLLSNVSNRMDEMVKSMMLTSLHKEEIAHKYSGLVSDFYEKKKNKGFLKEVISNLRSKRRKKILEVNIHLKQTVTPETIIDRMVKSDMPRINYSNIPYPKVEAKFYNPMPPYEETDNKVFLKNLNNNDEIPIHMLLDDVGNNMDDNFAFGIVVNLN